MAYLFWRWALKKDGYFQSWLDAWFFGSSRGMNDYDSLAANYKKSNIKPDKLYSILPTVLKMVGDCKGKVLTDIGCGGGFFTLHLAEQHASRVYGLDNSEAQIRLALDVSPHPAIRYYKGDVFTDPLPKADTVVVPFVVNYARTAAVLQHFFRNIFTSLNEEGKAVFVFDMPNGKSLEKFGAAKKFLGPQADETPIKINLFNGQDNICTLTAVYYTPKSIERMLRAAGFKEIQWHKPIVSPEGVAAMGADFWEGYKDDPELGYLTAQK